MGQIRERIDISAPVQRVWQVVHIDIADVPRWSENLLRTEVVGGGRLRVGSELLYVVKLPAGRTQELTLRVEEYDEYQRCAGTLRGGPVRGTWSWSYTVRSKATSVLYESVVQLSGLLRFAGGFVEEQAAVDVRRNLQGLKRYVESQSVSAHTASP